MNNSTGDRIRVLIVDDIPETRENLKKLLYFEPEVEVVGAASSGEQALGDVRTLLPDVILMDINMPGLDGISAAELISHEAPQAQIIMMSVQGEADYLRRSMLAGAREFLIKPFSSEELVSTIRRVYELGAPKRLQERQPAPSAHAPAGSQPATPAAGGGPGQVIAIYSPKGGVGCSTLAANLMVALREAAPEAKVLLVDANLQFGGIEVLLNLQSKRSIVDLAEKVDDLDAEFVNSVVCSHPCGAKVLLAPPRPEMADLVTSEHMLKIMHELQRVFDFIIVDTRSSLHDIELTILEVAARVILITTPEIPAIKNAKVFFDVTSALEYPPDKVVMVLNEVDRRGAIRAEDIEASIRHPISGTIPSDGRAAYVAANQGVPMVVSHRNSPTAQSILDLSRWLVASLQPQSEAAAGNGGKSSSLLGKLFR